MEKVMKTYYIYHIKGVKWGCTNNLKRRLKQQKYTLTDVCEIIQETDLDTAADLEKQLNLRDGYKWRDDQDYRVILKAGVASYKDKKRIGPLGTFTKKDCQLGGYITGIKKGEKQQIARRNNVAKLNAYQTCPYCGIHTGGVAYYRYHGNNCKLKP
jgi:hypothetical protein